MPRRSQRRRLHDKWSIARTTSTVSPASQLRFTYGTSNYYSSNPALFAFGADGNMGIGTTTPAARLDIENATTDTSLRVTGHAFFADDLKVGYGSSDSLAKVNIASGTDVDISGGGYLVLGSVTGTNLAIDTNELQARSNGTASTFYINNGGGSVVLGGATTIKGNLTVKNASGTTLVELGEGLDYAEGFNTPDKHATPAGSVMIIDAAHPGQLALSTQPYDKRVAGIVAGARNLGSGVRLGTGQFDVDIALAGRVYCYVDATDNAVEPGDLLTTSPLPGYAMKATDPQRAMGAILGKAMEPLKHGEKGQILVLVTLQ